ncbi:MAG: hypothetical protein II821_06795 [Treponema sp.]|nr:hypothetical protein [Treponema sp.]
MRSVWFFLMQKRLLKKPSFIIILCLVFPLVFAFRACSEQKSGVLTVALFQKDDENNPQTEDFALKIMDELESSVPQLNFIRTDSETLARNLVKEKKADAAWIFDRNLERCFEKMGEDGKVKPVFTAVEGEESSALAFVREVLYTKIYPLFSYSAYKSFVTERYGKIPENQLKSEYQHFLENGSLFVHKSLSETEKAKTSFLLSPLRGLLALWFMICVFASTLYYIQDEKKKSFVFLRIHSPVKEFFFSLSMQAIPSFDALIVLFCALSFTGLCVNLSSEIVSLLMFFVSAVLFSNFLRLILKDEVRFCAILPMLILVILVSCPIFVNVGALNAVKYLLPPFYYLNAYGDLWYVRWFITYISALFFLSLGLSFLKSNL